MVRFLFEYALPLDEKAIDQALSPGELAIISSEEQRLSKQGRFPALPQR